MRVVSSKTKYKKKQIFIFLLKIYLQKNDLINVRVIFWDVAGYYIKVYNFILFE